MTLKDAVVKAIWDNLAEDLAGLGKVVLIVTAVEVIVFLAIMIFLCRKK